MKQKMIQEEKLVPKANCPICAKVKQILKSHGIDAAKYHGCDLEGNAVKILMADAPNIFDSIQLLFKECAEQHGLPEYITNNLVHRLIAMSNCLVLFGGYLSCCRRYKDTVGDNFLNWILQIAEIKEYQTKAMHAWRSLGYSITLKVHAPEDHMLQQLENFKGFKCLNEEFIERFHQDGIKNNC